MRTILKWTGAVATVVVAVAAWNFFGIAHPVSARLAEDSRNEKLTMWAYHEHYIMPSVVVVDLRHLGDDAAGVDVMRALLHSAESLKDSKFDHVVLAYKGQSKFVLDGAYFQKLGEEFKTQNPVYTLRTLPENVKKLDGTAAYGTWTGGMLGVMTRQMEDFSQFSKDWYLDDFAKEHS